MDVADEAGQRTALRSMLTTVLAAALVALPAGAALAHAKLLRAQPAPGAKVTIAPTTVRVWFKLAAGEELDASKSLLSIWNAAGKRVDDGKGGVDLKDLDRLSMVARLKPLKPGTYTVKWKAVSDPDGGVARGSFTFTVLRKP
ncbi:MAG: copper resistance CopC family protein [Gemmatimonadales bacterium]